MRIVFDTNVLIAALIASEGQCAHLIKYCVQFHTSMTSQFILDELAEKLAGKFKRNPIDVEEAIAVLRSGLMVVSPVRLESPVCRDPDDDAILGTAIAGEAQCIITGDKDLLVLTEYKGIDILSPHGFWEYEEASAGNQ